MSPKSASDNSSSGGEPREELAAIIENSRATVDRLKRIIASQQQLLEIEKDLPAGHDDSETCRESTHMVINRLEEHRRELDALNAELGKYINELGRRASNRDITDLEQAEKALKLTQASIDLAANEILWITPEGEIVYANEATCRALQRSRDELLGMYVWEIHPRYTRDKWQEHWREIKERGSFTFEAIHYAKDGRELPVEVSVNYVKSDGREFNFAYIKDITERRLASEALRVSEERYRELVENANSIILRFDVRGRLTFFNEYAEKLFGYSKYEVLGRDVMGTIVPLSESTGRNLNKIMEEMKRCPERYHSNVNENICKNGDRVWIAWTNKAIRDEQGNVVEILSVGNDITEQKRAEEALRVSEGRLRRACSAGHIGLFEWNADRDLTYFSPETYELYGLEPGSPVTYEKFFARLHPDDREMFRRRFAENHENARRMPDFSAQIEYRVVHDDGAVLWLEVLSTFALEGGDLILWGAVRDITERKLAEEALIKSEASLARSQAIAHLANWEMDVGTGRVRVSDEIYRIFNLGPDAPQEAYGEKIHPDDRARVLESVNAAIYEGKPYSIDYRIVPCPGEVRHVHADGETIRDRAGRPLSFFGTVQDITERKRMEEALRESEEKLRLAIDGAGMGMWDWNIETDVLVWSDRCKKIVGISKDKVLDYGAFLNAIHPGDRERIDRAVKQALDNKEDYGVEMRIPWHDGTVHWAACRGRGLYNKAGKAVRMIGMAVDITDYKRSAEALRVSEGRLRRTSRAGRVGLYEWNEDQDTVYLSPEAYELFGLEPGSTVTSEKFFARVHPDDRETFMRSSTEAREKAHNQSSASAQGEFRVVHEDRSVLWLEATATYDLEGGDVMVRGAVRDITERKQAEEALRVSEERLRRASRAGQIGLYEWNVDRDLTYFSPEAYELYGCDPGSPVTYETWLAAVHSDDREMVERQIAGSIQNTRNRSGESTMYEFRVVHQDGTVHWLEATSTGELEDGDIIARGAVRDITERKRAEDELANAKAQAELYVDLMGHDINNFNLVARGYLELMDGVADGELKELVAKPMEAIDSSSRLIQNVQKLQRARSGGNHLDVLDLGELIGEVAGQFKSSPDRPVNITCDVVKGIRVRANELLRDVFVNLVGNAIKHSTGPASINIRVVPDGDGRGHCRVTIDDNGPGVPDDMKEKIFDRLRRGNTKARGSGLGLYLVKSLVESYGGKVWVEDRVKGDHTKGARFVVMLPTVEK